MPVATDILSPHAIVRLEDDAVVMLDQRRLPAEVVELRLTTWQQVAEAIRDMAVRGAPAIGVAAAYGVALAAARSTAGSVEVLREDVARAAAGLAATRPTAVNLSLGGRADGRGGGAAASRRGGAARGAAGRAEAIHADEVDRCVRIGEHGAEPPARGSAGADPLQRGRARDRRVRDGAGHDPRRAPARSRPARLGGRDPAAAPGRAPDRLGAPAGGDPATLITDSAAAWLMAERQGRRGRDRRRPDRPNGDTANKIGTYGARRARPRTRPAVLRRRSDVDHRPARSRAGATSRSSTAAATRSRPAPPQGVGVYNPAFDVTPAEYVSAIVTERGVHRPPYLFSLSAAGVSTLRAALARHGQEQLLRFWEELDAGRAARLAAEVEEIDLDLVDGLVREPARAGRELRPSARWRRPRWCDRAPRTSAPGAAVLGGGRGGGRDRRRRPGDAARVRRPQGLLPDRPGLRPDACSRSTPRRWWRSAAGTARRCRST